MHLTSEFFFLLIVHTFLAYCGFFIFSGHLTIEDLNLHGLLEVSNGLARWVGNRSKCARIKTCRVFIWVESHLNHFCLENVSNNLGVFMH